MESLQLRAGLNCFQGAGEAAAGAQGAVLRSELKGGRVVGQVLAFHRLPAPVTSRNSGRNLIARAEGIDTSKVTSRRECLLSMAMVGLLASQERASAEGTEVVDASKTEAVDASKTETVDAPKTEAVDASKTEAVDAPKTEAVDAPRLEFYVDEKEGFKLLRPTRWNKVEKAGATVLFEDPAKRGNTIGVVVNPVRISSLKDFGTPDAVAEKLLAAERKKPSTNDVQLVRAQERQAKGDIPLYALEYTLDSSRGQKRILSAVTVASKKLYILNITYVDSAAAPAPPEMAQAFTQVLNSFDLLA